MDASDPAVVEALRLLGVRRLVLAIHDASFPSSAEEDVGRGSPYGAGAREFLAFVRGLGFTGVQLGPQGETSADDPSPYDGTAFARGALSISLAELARDLPWGGLVAPEDVAAIVARRPADRARAHHAFADREQRAALARAWSAFEDARRRVSAGGARTSLEARVAELVEPFATFRARHADWLERDALFEVLAHVHGTADWRAWPGADARLWSPEPEDAPRADARLRALRERFAADVERHAFVQLLAHEQHRAFRADMRALGLEVRGDIQIGFAHRDRWGFAGRFLRGWALGAPPSRTNPAGQAWGYPVLDPDQYFASASGALAPGPARALFRARMAKAFAEYDGVRIDHPHGLVCPWVYPADARDPDVAVARGARLFESPAVAEHPALARFAIARPDQLARDPRVPRHADDWVRALEPEQIDRYAVLLDDVVEAARAAGRGADDVACEVLSTCPTPLRLVLERHRLGRFRVTQKAMLDDPSDVYRTENASPADWVMIGTHDTEPIWLLVREWGTSGELRRQVEFLARRLAPSPADVSRLERLLASDPGAVAQAKLAELFASPAENAMVFFADLLGIADVFNRPGVRSEENWRVRVPPGWREDYAERRARGRALDVSGALALAIESRGASFAGAHRGLVERLRRASPWCRSSA
ncbi:MAG TPA: 4-alpha-glucanotransferase [Candidatus Binatia bacterium]|nr:4-alpha-glucanotransferase [Candidatus Binatia bacterium]